jgi:hypothetical protein
MAMLPVGDLVVQVKLENRLVPLLRIHMAGKRGKRPGQGPGIPGCKRLIRPV